MSTHTDAPFKGNDALHFFADGSVGSLEVKWTDRFGRPAWTKRSATTRMVRAVVYSSLDTLDDERAVVYRTHWLTNLAAVRADLRRNGR